MLSRTEQEDDRIIDALAALQREKMAERTDPDRHPHWSKVSRAFLLRRLVEEVAELFGALPGDDSVEECADVANIAAMIADYDAKGYGS